jgi:hypothetical protein
MARWLSHWTEGHYTARTGSTYHFEDVTIPLYGDEQRRQTLSQVHCPMAKTTSFTIGLSKCTGLSAAIRED